jgi:O-antigen/teichoic acid export membrane protein
MRVANVASSVLLLANLMRAISQWTFVWLAAQFGGAEIVGQYALALAIVTPVFIAADLSLRNVYVSLRRSVSFGSVLLVRLAFGALALAVLAILGILGAVDPAVLLILGLIRFTDSVLDLCYGWLQRQGRIVRIGWTSILNSVVTIIIGSALYAWSGELVIALAGSLAGSLITTALVFTGVARAAAGTTPAPRDEIAAGAGAVIRAGVPSGLAFASVSLLTYTPLYLLGISRGDEQVGQFAVIAYFAVLANLVLGSIQQATLHDYVTAFRDGGDERLRRTALRNALPLVVVGLACFAVTLVLGAPVIQALYGAAFTPSLADLLPVALSVAILPVVVAAGQVLLTKNRYGLQLAIGAISLTVAIAAGLAMLPGFSVAAAGWVLMAGTVSRAVLGAAAASYAIRSHR